jgi:uncharacterized protein YndB with AHSA1/START domain
MPINTMDFQCSPEAAFSVLADPGSYGDWVVGAADIRDADPDWPAPGTTFHHTQGVRYVGFKDSTSVLDAEPPRRLVLEVRVRPLLTAEVSIDLDGTPHGTRVTMTERPLRGWIADIYRPRIDRAIALRNAVSLRRLKRLCEA